MVCGLTCLLNFDHCLVDGICAQVAVLGLPLSLLIALDLSHELGAQSTLPGPLGHLDHLNGFFQAQGLVSCGLVQEKRQRVQNLSIPI